jgi:cobalamin biosynthesis protein CobT
MTSMPGTVRMCTRILWPGKASDKTPRGVVPPVCVKYSTTPQEKNIIFFLSSVSSEDDAPLSSRRSSKRKRKSKREREEKDSKKRGRGRPAATKRRKRDEDDDEDKDEDKDSDEDEDKGSDFDASEDESASDDDGSSSGDEEEKDRPERPKAQLTTDLKLLQNIDPRLERNWIRKEENKRISAPGREEDGVKHWLHFVWYIKEQEKEAKKVRGCVVIDRKRIFLFRPKTNIRQENAAEYSADNKYSAAGSKQCKTVKFL